VGFWGGGTRACGEGVGVGGVAAGGVVERHLEDDAHGVGFGGCG